MIAVNKGVVELISAIPDILELESQDLLRHSLSVAYLSRLFAQGLGCNCETEAFISGLVHDIGSFDIAYQDIHRNDYYSDISDKRVLSHPLISAQIVSSIPGLSNLADIVIAHHERFDGLGYPLKRFRDQIPPESQIVRIADSLSVKFNHSNMFDLRMACAYIEEQKDKEFNSNYSDSIKNILNTKGLNEILRDPLRLKSETAKIIDNLYETIAQPGILSVEEILFFFSQVLDAKHSYSENHSIRVSNYSVLIALSMGVNTAGVETVRIAALLHDLGKLGVPKNILDKPADLNDKEMAIIRLHPDFAVKIIRKISPLVVFLPVLQSDQEHWDGKGYPKGLKGEEIPLYARIILVADAFDAMTSDRAYRKAMPINDAIAELERCSGTDFDPRVVKIACALFKNLDMPEPPKEKSF